MKRRYAVSFCSLFFIATIFAVLVITTVVAAVLILGIGEELADGELHLTEDRAGIVVITRLAVLFGEAEVAGGKHKLNLAFHTDNRENADSNVNVVHADFINEIAVEARTDKLGNRIDAHTAMAVGLATLHKLTVEADRRSNFNDHGGKSGLAVAAQITLVEAEGVLFGIGSEYRNVLFAAEKDNLLIEGAKSLYLVHSAAAYASFESYTEIIADSYLIKASVERYGLDIDVGVDYLNTFAPYGACFIDYFLSHIAEVHANILEAILIARGIKYLIHADAAKLFLAVAAKPAQRVVSFNHYNSSLIVWIISLQELLCDIINTILCRGRQKVIFC